MLGSIEFGKWLQQLRKKAGLNQEELAEQVGVHYNTVSQWENGKYTPNTAKIKTLATVLNVSESDLLNGPVKQEFEVKILMGVKSLANVAGLEIKDNSFFYGVDDEKPEIHIGGKVNIATIEDREKALKKITESFLRACWMFDHRDEAGLAIQTA
ncbi:MAG: helix-turn-helix transcriptional regulator [Selenomonadaceae bacterium]|nr:helix-turn-helix transcriptional regulator [Selenomonadaceae bacterium]